MYKIVKPRRAAAPIQYHSFSVKASKLFNVAIPNVVEPSEDCKTCTFEIKSKFLMNHLTTFSFGVEEDYTLLTGLLHLGASISFTEKALKAYDSGEIQ